MKVLRISLLILMVFSLMTGICYGQTAKDYCERGIEYGVAEKFEEAQQECKKALEIDPFFEPAKECLKLVGDVLKQRIKTENALHQFKGAAYGSKGMYDEEIAEYKRAIEINPNYAQAHCSLGAVYSVKGMYDEAIGEFKKAIEINPNYALPHNNLAIVYYCKREYSLAIKHCDRAIELGYRVQPKLLELLKPYREGLEKI